MSDQETDQNLEQAKALQASQEDGLAAAFTLLREETPPAPPWLANRIVANLPQKVAWYDWLFAHPLRWSSLTACSLLLGLGLGLSGGQSDTSLDNQDLLFADTLPMDQWEITFEP